MPEDAHSSGKQCTVPTVGQALGLLWVPSPLLTKCLHLRKLRHNHHFSGDVKIKRGDNVKQLVPSLKTCSELIPINNTSILFVLSLSFSFPRPLLLPLSFLSSLSLTSLLLAGGQNVSTGGSSSSRVPMPSFHRQEVGTRREEVACQS